MTPVDAFSLNEGAVFHDQYQIVRRIDSGAMGTVYEVTDRRTKRRRALKVMLARFVDNADVTERFRREATITADVHSEHVVETFDAGVDKTTGLPFLVMELLRGEDLGKIVARGPLPAAEIVVLLMQAASALDKMHAAGVIHRDLKPENLFVSRRDDGAPRLKILDFGIAKVIEKAATSATSTRNMGTPVYMSPEQVTGLGTVSVPADLYALGQLAYTMLVGQPYWLEDALAFETVYPLLLRIMEGAVESASARALRNKNVTLPAGFDAWFAKATAKEPEDRFKTAADSILALSEALTVPRPALPSWLMEHSIATSPTLTPEGANGASPAPAAAHAETEEPLPLVPPSQRGVRTAKDEALRTLSPVSTPPGSSARRKRRGGLLIGLGAAFFICGVLATVLIVRRPKDERGAATSAATTATPAASLATTATLEPTAPSKATAIEPAQSAQPLPSSAPSAASAAPEPSTSTATAPSGAPVKKTNPTVRNPRAPGKGAPGPKQTYGDPGRDL